jgi:hypothetical protein
MKLHKHFKLFSALNIFMRGLSHICKNRVLRSGGFCYNSDSKEDTAPFKGQCHEIVIEMSRWSSSLGLN